MNDREKAAVKELKNYNGYKVKIANLQERIRVLKEISNQGVSYDGVRVDSGFRNNVENNLITRIGKVEELERILKITEANVTIIERALDNLTEDERKVLTAIYINRQYCAYDKLAEELNIGRSNVYKIKAAALKVFSNMISTM